MSRFTTTAPTPDRHDSLKVLSLTSSAPRLLLLQVKEMGVVGDCPRDTQANIPFEVENEKKIIFQGGGVIFYRWYFQKELLEICKTNS